MKHLYVAWQDEDSREWVPVALLESRDDGYTLQYTKGAKRCKSFVGLGRMDALDQVYQSEQLFPFFQNRMINKSRPEYKNYLRWLGLDELTDDPFSILTVTGGLRATDSFELIPPPERDGDNLRLDFFPRGLRHMPEGTQDLISQLAPNDRLYLVRDIQNPKDPNALLLRTDAPNALVGYINKYYCSGLGQLLAKDSETVTVHVKQVNRDAPLEMRLLCTLKAPAALNFKLLECESDFLPWVSETGDANPKEVFRNAGLELGFE